jgi:hexosaminidase
MNCAPLWRMAIQSVAALLFFVPGTRGETRTSRPEPRIVPQPREMETTRNSLRLFPESRIVILSSAKEDRFAAQLLAEEFKELTGKENAVTTDRHPGTSPEILLGRFTDARVQSLLRLGSLKTEGVTKEGYILEVTGHRALIAGKDGAGLFYGVQTLRQLIVPSGRGVEIPGVRIRDWPALGYRGTQVDLSRGPVLRLDSLKRIVRTIAEFKLNQLNLYMEDSFPLEGHPLVGVLDDQLSKDDFVDLVRYAGAYHVEIIPATEGCGHLHKVLRFEKYSEMGERPRGHDLAAGASDAASYLADFYSQLNSVFVSPLSNIGCDETHELGTGRSATEVQHQGYAKVYLESLKRAYQVARSQNRQVIFWGDMAVAHPEVISELPKDIIVATWEYFPRPSYEKWIKPFADASIKIIVCPWVGNTNLIIPNYDVAAYNIANFIDEGKKAGAIGVNVTVWNDDGESLFAPNWWSIAYGAANAWEQNKTDVAEFDKKFDWAFYRNADHRFTQALKNLSRVNELLGRQGIKYVYSTDFGGANDRLFWRDPFSTEGRNDVENALPVAGLLRRIAEDAFTVFAIGQKDARRHADTIPYLEFAALKLDALGMRYQYLSDISQDYSRILAHEKTVESSVIDNELFQIQGINGPLFDLRDYTTKLRGMYRTLWASENGSSWLPNMLQLYDLNSALWQRHIAQFEEIKAAHREGKSLPRSESLELLRLQPNQ